MAPNKQGIADINLYDLLGVQFEAEQADIRKAYRKKALACHPDKNPDNPNAAEVFHELANALSILSDPTARAAYDKVLKAKRAAELRTKQLDSKRQKLKSDLEQREREAVQKLFASQPYTTVRKSDEDVLREEIERLRREGSRLLEEEQRLMREQLQRKYMECSNSKQEVSELNSARHRIKIKWKAEEDDDNNGGYTQEKLKQYLKKYGEIEALVMSTKNGNAMVELKTFDACEMVMAYEKGLLENPLRFEWAIKRTAKESSKRSTNASASSLDYEDLVMRKMRQAEERKRLIAELQKGDE